MKSPLYSLAGIHHDKEELWDHFSAVMSWWEASDWGSQDLPLRDYTETLLCLGLPNLPVHQQSAYAVQAYVEAVSPWHP